MTAADLATIRQALAHAELACRFHGTNFEKLGMDHGEPRCDSCKQPWRNNRAIAALTRLEHGTTPLRGVQIGDGNTQTNMWGG